MTEDGRTDGPIDGEPEQLPDGIRALARAINEPPATPRDEIWARVEARRATRQSDSRTERQVASLSAGPSAGRTVRRPVWQYAVWGSGIAAVLLIGIALGRRSVNVPAGTGPSTVAAAPDTAAMPRERKNAAYTVAAVQHLSRVETFLTTLRTSKPDSQFAGQARDLLTSTRLLLDARDMDPRLRRLLSDLEDILVQVVQYDANGRREDLDLITDVLNERQLLPRLHSVVPAGQGRAL